MSGVKGLQNLGLSSALMTLEQRGTLIVPNLRGQEDQMFAISSKGPTHLVALYTVGKVH